MNRKWYIYALFVLAALTGCRKQPVPDAIPVLPEETKEMVISVKSDAPDPKFTFLFWHKEDFDRGLLNANQGVAQPYHVSEPTGDIGDYIEQEATTNEPSEKKKDYNTGRVYPDSYGIAVCTGYGPYNEVYPSGDDSGMTDYRTLKIENPGVTDVVVPQNYLEGSSIYPFYGNLEFFHPQIQLTVKAKLTTTMAKFIKNVSFTVGKDNLMKSLSWSGEVKGYRPSSERPENGWTSATLEEQINSSDEKVIGTVNVVPLPSAEEWTMKSINLTIKGEIGNTVDGSYSEFTMDVPAFFKDNSDNELTLELNDSYIILLLFDEDQIEITAVKVPWKEGGNVLVPIHPIPAD